MIPQAAEDTEGCFEAGQRPDHRTLRGWIPGDKVAGQGHQVRLQRIGDSDILPDLRLGHERSDVDVGKLRDAEAVKRLGQTRQPDTLRGGLQVKTAVEQTVCASYERRGDDGGGGALEELPAAG